jgi:hypothetical protein
LLKEGDELFSINSNDNLNNSIIVNIEDLEKNTGFGTYDYIGVEFSITSDIANNKDYYIEL